MTDVTRSRAEDRTGPTPTGPTRTELNRKEEALWLFQRFAPDSAVDNLPLAVRTSADVDLGVLSDAVRVLMRRYPALRTCFPARHGAPRRQAVDVETVRPPVDGVEIPRAELAGALTALAGRPFDLTRELPFRVTRVALREGGSVLCVVCHHIASDGVSGGIVVPELASTYWRLAGARRSAGPDSHADAGPGAGPEAGFGPVEDLVEAPPTPQSLRYWIDTLTGVDPAALALRAARPEPVRPTFAGARFEQRLSPGTHAALHALRTRLRVTDNMVLLAAYCLLLARHGAGPDLVVAVPVNVRRRGATRAVGYHVNTLPLRVAVDLRGGFAQLVGQVRDRLVEGLAHCDASFESLLGELSLDTMNWRAPLFRHMFNYLPPSGLAAPGELPDSAWVTVDPGLSRHDLQFLLVRWPGAVSLQAVYSTEIHDEATVRSLAERYELLLAAAAGDVDRPLAQLDLWHPRERGLVARVNASASAPVPAPTVPALIGRRLGTTPTAPAIVEADGEVHDLGRLAARAGALRVVLAGAGVGAGDVVALCAPRGPGLAAAVLATWSLGAGYLPLDPGQPASRLTFQLDRAAARVVVTGDVALPPACTDGRRTVPVAGPGNHGDAPGGPIDGAAGGARDGVARLRAGLAGVDPDAVAYTIFTSGSTGQPKGVEVTHRNLANLVRSFAALLEVTGTDRVLWLTTFGFDISALELYLPLCHGGGAVVAPDEAQVRPAVLLDLVTRHDVAVVQSTPTIWRLVAPALDGELAGRRVLCGGEPLSGALATRLVRAGCRLFNVYGPTETTIWSTVARFDDLAPGAEVTDPVGIGVPIGETSLHVVDEFGQDAPPGVVGELCIGGTGVARGYTGRPELTAERFRTDARRGRHYRTGDLAVWRRDGTLELLGRADRQVKLRGRRIEPGEIEAALEQHPAVAAAAVVVRGDPQGDGRLVGYLQPVDQPVDQPVGAGGVRFDLAEVGRFVREVLPYYLVPADLVRIDRLPRNASGKVDHRALPEVAGPGGSPDGADGGPAGGGADDEMTAALVAAFQEVLGRADLGVTSNFFTAGGHSLLAAILAARVGELLDRQVTLMDVFSAPTPRELAELIRAQDAPVEEVDR